MSMVLFAAAFSWWYGVGWVDVGKQSLNRLVRTSRVFSATTLILTLFAPWRQILTPVGSAGSFDRQFQAGIDNVISRFVGLLVRLVTLLAWSTVSVVLAVTGVLILIIWPFVPVICCALLLHGIGVITLWT